MHHDLELLLPENFENKARTRQAGRGINQNFDRSTQRPEAALANRILVAGQMSAGGFSEKIRS
jgi:hypothetical protein